MYYKDHNPPHFHATHGEHEVAIAISDGTVLWGSLPGRVLGHVEEWRRAHVPELEDDWERARRQQPLNAIAPLE